MEEVSIYHLEMHSRDQLRPASAAPGLDVAECRLRQFQVNRFFYQFVGDAWEWHDKLSWTDQEWRDYAERDELRTWMATVEGSPAGYYELERQPGDDVEIKYFGLAPAFIGRGMGGALLSHALASAWDWDKPGRVWVHTCSLDHPSALANYRARGMSHYKTETVTV